MVHNEWARCRMHGWGGDGIDGTVSLLGQRGMSMMWCHRASLGTERKMYMAVPWWSMSGGGGGIDGMVYFLGTERNVCDGAMMVHEWRWRH